MNDKIFNIETVATLNTANQISVGESIKRV